MIKRVFIKQKFIFIHIPKTAGSSISASIFGKIISNHHTVRDYILDFTSEDLENYFKFCFVRHPEDRFLSLYGYLKSGGTKDNQFKGNVIDLTKIAKNSNSVNDFIEELKQDIQLRNHHFIKPMHFFVTNEKGEVFMDFIGRQENFTDDFNFIINKIGLKIKIKTKNQNKKSKKNILNNNSKKFIEDFYKNDYEFFGYEKRSLTK